MNTKISPFFMNFKDNNSYLCSVIQRLFRKYYQRLEFVETISTT